MENKQEVHMDLNSLCLTPAIGMTNRNFLQTCCFIVPVKYDPAPLQDI